MRDDNPHVSTVSCEKEPTITYAVIHMLICCTLILLATFYVFRAWAIDISFLANMKTFFNELEEDLRPLLIVISITSACFFSYWLARGWKNASKTVVHISIMSLLLFPLSYGLLSPNTQSWWNRLNVGIVSLVGITFVVSFIQSKQKAGEYISNIAIVSGKFIKYIRSHPFGFSVVAAIANVVILAASNPDQPAQYRWSQFLPTVLAILFFIAFADPPVRGIILQKIKNIIDVVRQHPFAFSAIAVVINAGGLAFYYVMKDRLAINSLLEQYHLGSFCPSMLAAFSFIAFAKPPVLNVVFKWLKEESYREIRYLFVVFAAIYAALSIYAAVHSDFRLNSFSSLSIWICGAVMLSAHWFFLTKYFAQKKFRKAYFCSLGFTIPLGVMILQLTNHSEDHTLFYLTKWSCIISLALALLTAIILAVLYMQVMQVLEKIQEYPTIAVFCVLVYCSIFAAVANTSQNSFSFFGFSLWIASIILLSILLAVSSRIIVFCLMYMLFKGDSHDNPTIDWKTILFSGIVAIGTILFAPILEKNMNTQNIFDAIFIVNGRLDDAATLLWVVVRGTMVIIGVSGVITYSLSELWKNEECQEMLKKKGKFVAENLIIEGAIASLIKFVEQVVYLFGFLSQIPSMFLDDDFEMDFPIEGLEDPSSVGNSKGGNDDE